MDMDDVADASEIHVAFIFKVPVCKFPCKCIYIYVIIFRETWEGREVWIGTSSGANRDNKQQKL